MKVLHTISAIVLTLFTACGVDTGKPNSPILLKKQGPVPVTREATFRGSPYVVEDGMVFGGSMDINKINLIESDQFNSSAELGSGVEAILAPTGTNIAKARFDAATYFQVSLELIGFKFETAKGTFSIDKPVELKFISESKGELIDLRKEDKTIVLNFQNLADYKLLAS